MAQRPIRLLCYTAESFPTERVDVAVLFGRELLSRGHAIDFVMQAASSRQPGGRQPWNGRTVFVGRTRDGGSAFARVARQLLEFVHDLRCLRLLGRGDYDAVQVRDKFMIAPFAARRARRLGLKFYFWLSFPMPESDLENARAGNAFIPAITLLRGRISGSLLYRWILPRADHVFVQSERMLQQVAARGVDPGRMTPVPMGVDLSSLPPFAPRRARSAADELVIGYLGTLDAIRRLGVLVEMLALLRRAGVPARLLLIGDAVSRRDRSALESQAVVLGVRDALEITGMLPRAEAMRRMNEAHLAISPIFRSPILDVGSPTKLVEYLAMGVPVVANSHPEQRSILAATRAGVCTPWGARHFARAVRWLLRRPAAELEQMGARGREWVLANRAYPVIAERLESRYLELAPAATHTGGSTPIATASP